MYIICTTLEDVQALIGNVQKNEVTVVNNTATTVLKSKKPLYVSDTLSPNYEVPLRQVAAWCRELKVGETRNIQAHNPKTVYSGFRNAGRVCSIKKKGDFLYQVTRKK